MEKKRLRGLERGPQGNEATPERCNQICSRGRPEAATALPELGHQDTHVDHHKPVYRAGMKK
jgi:hypothetical protein